MDLDVIEDQLRPALADLKPREIGQAFGLDAAMAANRAGPAIYLIPLSETGTPIPGTGELTETEDRVFAVLYIVPVLAGTKAPQLVQYRQRVKETLIGFVPDEATGEPVHFLGGELIQFNGDGRLVWSDEFSFRAYFRSTQ